ncbi:unnamed protein product [Rodentolepis nana]|uniref:FAD/NAD(P)-binding oxidoreductase family protein n=1 Tax=Rodentolepis nana TaxID=102285 RepID=A0A0R3TYK3_RODNA|nr:unnamed protein product [Rodentolepis nana]
MRIFDQINVNEIWMVSFILSKPDGRGQCILKFACDFDFFAKDQKWVRWTTAKDMETLLSSPWLWAPSEGSKLEVIASWINAATSSCERGTLETSFAHFLSTLNIKNISASFIAEGWKGFPDMSTGRCESGAVQISDLGVLVLGGAAEYGGTALNTVELLQSSADNSSWCSFSPFFQPRSTPTVEFFKECVYVASSLNTCIQSTEVLSITDGRPGQWTLVSHYLFSDSRLSPMLAVSDHLHIESKYLYIFMLCSQANTASLIVKP